MTATDVRPSGVAGRGGVGAAVVVVVSAASVMGGTPPILPPGQRADLDVGPRYDRTQFIERGRTA